MNTSQTQLTLQQLITLIRHHTDPEAFNEIRQALVDYSSIFSDKITADLRPDPNAYPVPIPQVTGGWLDAAVAWEVCASVHATWAKGKDAMFKTRNKDYLNHAERARAKHQDQSCGVTVI